MQKIDNIKCHVDLTQHRTVDIVNTMTNNINNFKMSYRLPPLLWYLCGSVAPVLGIYLNLKIVLAISAILFLIHGVCNIIFDSCSVMSEYPIKIESYHGLFWYEIIMISNIKYKRNNNSKQSNDIEKKNILESDTPVFGEHPVQKKTLHESYYEVNICVFECYDNFLWLIYFLGITNKNFTLDKSVAYKEKIQYC